MGLKYNVIGFDFAFVAELCLTKKELVDSQEVAFGLSSRVGTEVKHKLV